uniref:Uncharacterized protein n=1 Tax=Myoviridae sp. ct4yW2 TaxID=2827286 RepID=A0A8S5RAG1_9CAUD|nr:MAG TPA: hypothetical protein [Myoviridae sp. ct4yW2]DAO37598.1 MAG TPA: hypothetical protein [Herelleviridae sp.]
MIGPYIIFLSIQMNCIEKSMLNARAVYSDAR